MTSGVIFAKTAQGLAEIEARTAGLSARVRRVLIFVDGKRPVSVLRDLTQADDLTHTLGSLEEMGLIEVAAVAASEALGTAGEPRPGGRPAPVPPGERLPSIYAFRGDGREADPERLEMSRNFMGNTLRTFVGPVGATSLMERIDAAVDRLELRAVFDEWYHAMVMSRDGKRQAEELRGKLLEIV